MLNFYKVLCCDKIADFHFTALSKSISNFWTISNIVQNFYQIIKLKYY